MNYDQDQIAYEALDFSFLDMDFSPFVTLYHGTDEPDLTVIQPKSLNMGNRLNRKRRISSFWCKDFRYAIIWALDWVALRYNLPYIHDIERKLFIIPNWTVEDNDTEKRYSLKDFILRVLKKLPVYVYEAKIPGKYVGRGQVAIDEYTVDVPVKVTRRIDITPEMAKDLIVTLPDQQFDELTKKGMGLYQKQKLGVCEMLVFRNGRDVMRNRSEYLKRKREILENMKAAAVTESFLTLCDNLLQ